MMQVAAGFTVASADDLQRRAVRAAVEVLDALGVDSTETRVLGNAANTLVLLLPSLVVARVATTTSQVWANAEERLQREISLVTYLREMSVPVVPPSQRLPPGPHCADGLHMTLWEFVDGEAARRPSSVELAPHLARLHAVLRDCPVQLPFVSPAIEDARAAIAYLEHVDGAHLRYTAAMYQEWLELQEALQSTADAIQPLHGDAHPGNVICHGGSVLWIDFEDCCCGPVAWDLACLTQGDSGALEEVLSVYGTNTDMATVELCNRARELQTVVWISCLAVRFPNRQADLLGHLEGWHNAVLRKR